MQLYLVFLILIVIALGPLDSCGSFLLFQSGAVGLDFFYVVRGRGRRGIDSLYEYPSDRSKLPLTILNYCLPNMGDMRATIEVNNGKLCDVDLLVALYKKGCGSCLLQRFWLLLAWEHAGLVLDVVMTSLFVIGKS